MKLSTRINKQKEMLTNSSKVIKLIIIIIEQMQFIHNCYVHKSKRKWSETTSENRDMHAISKRTKQRSIGNLLKK